MINLCCLEQRIYKRFPGEAERIFVDILASSEIPGKQIGKTSALNSSALDNHVKESQRNNETFDIHFSLPQKSSPSLELVGNMKQLISN